MYSDKWDKMWTNLPDPESVVNLPITSFMSCEVIVSHLLILTAIHTIVLQRILVTVHPVTEFFAEIDSIITRTM